MERTGVKSVIGLKPVSPAFAIGLVLAVLYVFFVGLNIIEMLDRPEEQWWMFWTFLDYLNFPVSLLLRFVILPIYSVSFFVREPYIDRSRLTLGIFITFNLVVGGVWYFCLPFLLDKFSKKFASDITKKTAVILLAIIPIFCHWLQLLKHITGKTRCFSPVLNSWLPIIWTALFIWLYYVSGWKKKLLWLLCLVPAVFFYFVHDLHYYNMFDGWIMPH